MKSVMLAGFLLITTFIHASVAVNRPASSSPPGGLDPSQVPQFVVIGFDDNAYSGDSIGADSKTIFKGTAGMRWIQQFMQNLKNKTTQSPNAATYDGAPARVTFFQTSYYMSGYNGDNPALVRNITQELFNDGHEIGNHTHSHNLSWNNTPPTESGWSDEMTQCNGWLTKPRAPDTLAYWQQAESTLFGAGIPGSSIVGFRTPFLICDDVTFKAMIANGFVYDCSIEEGYQEDHTGANFYWPYTLDNGGTDGWDRLILMSGPEWDQTNSIPDKKPLAPQPGFWEVPNHCVIIPPDNECANYGISYSLRNAIKERMSWFNTEDGKFTGFDWNFWAQAKMNKLESIAVLKYTLDLRLRTNRAPFMWGAHTDNFTTHKDASYASITNRERQEVVEEFLTYALSLSDVRVVPARDIVAWCANPVPLGDAVSISPSQSVAGTFRITSISKAGAYISVPQSGAYTLLLSTLRGQKISKTTVSVSTNSNQTVHIPLENVSISGGMYLATLSGCGKTISQKVSLF